MKKADLPFNATTLRAGREVGLCEPRVFFAERTGFAYVDPALHAVPPSKGVVLYDGVGWTAWRAPVSWNKLRIDTTTPDGTASTSC